LESLQKRRYTYYDEHGTVHKYGLVCWKDWDVVYFMSNTANTVNVGSCYRRTNYGIKLIQGPAIIGLYNQHMGGVDLADMSCMHCNRMLMGQNHW
jgi:hypothetical protein